MDKDIEHTLRRIETRMIRGFNELGTDVLEVPNWLRVDGNTIYVTSIGHSLMAMIKRAKEKGAKIGEQEYEVVYEGEVVCWL